MKLIPMTEFVTQQFSKMMKSSNPALLQRELFTDPIMNYTNFLNTEITLSDLIPCNEKGKPFGKFIELGKGLLQKHEVAKNKLFFKINIDLDTAKFHVKQKRRVEYFTTFEIEISDYAIEKFSLKR